MTQQFALDTAHGALLMVLALAGPGLLVILIVGVVISAFQAMTQINEMMLSFVPKVIALGVLMVVLGPWMLQTAVNYTVMILTQLPNVVH
ncbi:MAG TPA: flagellar biosynthetic protein FliQ [Chloroflexota bacterium]|jgi:flagellar biosynthetic protein FliQ|nr:flagellar biosynthetic protein FliQ [Chloroflexota bacterium]